MARRKRRVGKFLFLFLIVIVALLAGALWWISPTERLDMGYRTVDFKDRLLQMAETREPRLTLSADEIGQLSKKNLVKYLDKQDPGVDITGARFTMEGSSMRADVNGKWGWVPFGAQLDFTIKTSGSRLLLEHQATRIRDAEVPGALFQLEPMIVNLKDYLPEMLTVRDIELTGDGVSLVFKIDWLSLPSWF
ncbi:hypothetical protein E6C60_3551 [Paenibacillus algicola]|uniref:Uncharacterized protein n=1 Tax=Paenibacillus algicola TaxID=2565926 RepID=A0A4P8XR56_9BACL|nr:hypothetical protein [Paenibacillus algicola]QCT04261.1 hypothetical protein E6C60_3551 [Paenibacillus algicola]